MERNLDHDRTLLQTLGEVVGKDGQSRRPLSTASTCSDGRVEEDGGALQLHNPQLLHFKRTLPW